MGNDSNDDLVPTPGAGAAWKALYLVPAVGKAAGVLRHVFREMAPTPNDPTEIRVLKSVFLGSSVVVGGAAWALFVLGAASPETGLDA